jgi:hypothetical protein
VRWPALGFVVLSSCLQIGSLDGADAGNADADGSANVKRDATDADTGLDANCVVDPLSRVTLCRKVEPCNGVTVDPDLHPSCGFRAGTGALDILCICDDWLCPLGLALSCAQARQILDWQSPVLACAQVSEGRCARRSLTPPPTGTCDKNCARECANDPGCLRLCGC